MRIKLLVLRGRPQGKGLAFPQGEFVIGRGDECHVRPNSSWVSRQHCLLRVTDHSVFLRDLGSTNGTLVNGQRILGERDVFNGDHIQIGPLVFQLLIEEGAAVQAHMADTGLHSTIDTAETRPLSDQATTATAEYDTSKLAASS
jgi:pSer/pThr/pTyr-binding forkhead associated (FHA) protein